jgi:dimethylargininase
VRVADSEPGAANVLRAGGRVIAHAGFPRTVDLLVARGADVRAIDVSEFLKAEAGVTCKSLLFRARTPPGMLQGHALARLPCPARYSSR